MQIKISPLHPKEYAWVSGLLDQEKRFAYLPDAFTPLWSFTPDGLPKVLWSITAGGELVGSAGCVLVETDRSLAAMGLIIAPTYRRQGIGNQVYNALIEWADQRNVQCLLTKVYTHQAAGLHFLAQHGFRERGASWHGQLHVAAAQREGWDESDAMVAAQGLRFTTLNRFPQRGLAERLLPIWNRTRLDQPQDWPYIPYSVQRFAEEMLEPEALALEHSYAIVTADQQIVALTLNIHYNKAQTEEGMGQRLFTVYSAVDPDFRRRGLATALKLKLIAHAQAHHIDFLAAENDERNVAMWQINQRLGYRRLADLLVYGRVVNR
jgi:GNAT superfamily N-acetyltransferase